MQGKFAMRGRIAVRRTERRVETGGRRSVSGAVGLIATATLVVGLSGCATAAEMVLPTVIEEITDDDRYPVGEILPLSDAERNPPADPPRPLSDGDRRRGAVTSVYVAGPVPGWERGPGSTHAFGTGPYFSAWFFGDACPSLLNLSPGGDADPFGRVDRARPEPFSMGNSLFIHPDYAPFGHVALGGPGTVGYPWQALGFFGHDGGGCGFPGFRLISFGDDDGPPILHR